MMNDRSFHLYDSSVCVAATTEEVDRRTTWRRPDWETFNRLHHALDAHGFTFGPDPRMSGRYELLAKYHRLGRRETPAGTLFVATETYPAGCKFEFYQEVVVENPNGGKYDFDRVAKMPYLIRKAFEVALRAIRAHLAERGFVENLRRTPNPDPLAFFNEQWDSEYDRRRGVHRFDRGPDGWPSDKVLASWDRTDRDGRRIEHGDVRYFRNRKGHLLRGRVYGGINGMWMCIYGPGARDCTHLHAKELFTVEPSAVPRRVVRNPEKRVAGLLDLAVKRQDFERAIRLRDTLARLQPDLRAAA